MGDTVAGQVALYKQIDYAPLSTFMLNFIDRIWPYWQLKGLLCAVKELKLTL